MTAAVESETANLIADVWNALDGISDPCHALSGQGLSILDLGLVNSVELVDDNIDVGITLTEVSCTFSYRIMQDIRALAADFPEVAGFRVIIQPWPAWTPDRLSERARSHYAETRLAFGPPTLPGRTRRRAALATIPPEPSHG